MVRLVSYRRFRRERAVARSPLLAHVPSELQNAMGKRICICKSRRFCYFRVPKAANSTIMNSLAFATFGSGAFDDEGVVAKGSFADITAASDLDADQMVARYLCFTFVRNPFTRVLSAYLDKIVADSNPKFREMAGLPDGGTFSGFLHYLRDSGLHANPHWAPQTSIIPIDPARLHFVGHVETIEADFARLSAMIFGGPMPLRTRQSGRTSARKLVSDVYTMEDRRLVEELYQQDFEQLYPDRLLRA